MSNTIYKKIYPHNAFDVSWYRKNDEYSLKYIIVQYVTANSPLRRIKNIYVKRKLSPAIRLL